MAKICPIKTAGAFAGSPNASAYVGAHNCVETECAWWTGEACAVLAMAKMGEVTEDPMADNMLFTELEPVDSNNFIAELPTTEKRRFIKCAGCGEFIDATNHNSNFKGHTGCLSTIRTRRYRGQPETEPRKQGRPLKKRTDSEVTP